ncbi:MAG: hypothetical protein GEV13_31325 [Rhodospirillales bacterium]|nr:hypothetical protein [Rhodospirillales bacterium]
MSNFGFDPPSPWLRFRPPPEDLPGFRVRPVDVAPDGVPGLAGWQPPATPTAQPALDNAPPAAEAGAPNFGFDPPSPWLRFRPPPEDLPGFRVRPVDVAPDGVLGLAGWQPPATPTAQPAPDNAPPAAEAASYPWWGRSTGPNTTFEGGSEPHWPWLRAPTDEVPGFRLNPDGSVRTDEQGGKVRLMAGAFAPLEPQEPLNEIAGSNGVTSSDVVPSPPAGAPLSTTSAASIALPASAGGAVDLPALAARAAPAVAGAGSAAVAALPLLFIPTNTQPETTELGDGLRARVRPGQRTVEIERRVDNGFFGTGIGAKWETLPVEAWRHVGRDGSVNTVINHEQLNRALGRSAAVESKDAGASAMAQSPKDGEPQRPPPANTGSGAKEANKPGIGNPPAARSLAPSRIDVKVLEEAKQRDPEEERLLACRAVRAMPGQSAPSGQYDGRGGIETNVGTRVAPGFPTPKGGYDYSPDYLRHWNGYKGELELKNRIEKAVPYEKFVHYGNPAGDQGPDVLTIGPDNRFMEWDSRSRMAKRRLGPSMASSASLQPEDVKIYVWNAIRSRAIAPDSGARALQELKDGNYNICTVGTGNAYDGYFESVRNRVSTGPRR